MSVTMDQPAPYAPASVILELIERHRNKGLPSAVDADVLLRAGVSDSLVSRTLQAMKTLDLLTEDGKPSEVFEGIRLAPTAEYQQRLTEWLNTAYADALIFIDPATDDEVAIRDAFRHYQPTGQQSRMVSLFVGLFTAAGVMPQKEKVAKTTRKARAPSTSSKTARVRERCQEAKQSTHQSQEGGDGPPPAIAGLIATLPKAGGFWTKGRRDQFLAILEAVLDYTFRIGEPPATETETEHDE